MDENESSLVYGVQGPRNILWRENRQQVKDIYSTCLSIENTAKTIKSILIFSSSKEYLSKTLCKIGYASYLPEFSPKGTQCSVIAQYPFNRTMEIESSKVETCCIGSPKPQD